MLRRLHLLLLRVYRRLPAAGRRFVVRRLAPSFTVGAMCFIERDDARVLLVRHSYRRHWGVPGGLLRRGEDPATAVCREVREEVGLEIELIGEPAVVVDADPRRVDIVYRARSAAGADPEAAAAQSPEILEARWFDRASFPELQSETSGALLALARASRRPSAPVLTGTDEGGLQRRLRHGP